MCLPWMPFAPSRGFERRLDVGVQEHHCGIRTPRPPKNDPLRALIGGELAVVEDVTRILLRVVLALRRVHNVAVREAVDLAMEEVRLRVAEDEVDVPFRVAVGKILPRRLARPL